MQLREVYASRFEHPVVSGSVFGYRWFVFAVVLGDDDSSTRRRFEELGINVKSDNILAHKEIIEYLNKERKVFSVIPKFLWGTPFQKRVWYETSLIPYGSVITYSELARRCGKPSAVRSVASALGANPIPIIIPCHRVVGKNGDLGGFSAGIDVKRKLLELEGIKL